MANRKPESRVVTGALEVQGRLPSSLNGNPRYRLSIGGLECRTGVDSGLAYGIKNYRGKTVTAHIRMLRGYWTVERVES